MLKIINILFIAIIVLIPITENAFGNSSEPDKYDMTVIQTPEKDNRITKVMANNFYEGCLDTPYHGLSKDERLLFCACSSAALHAFMNYDEYLLLSESQKSELGYQEAYLKMMEKVFMPCVADPLYKQQQKECLKKKAPRELMNKTEIPNHIETLCDCSGQYVRKYIEEFGAYDVMEKLNIDVNEKDPLRALFRSSQVREQRGRSYEYCQVKMYNKERLQRGQSEGNR